MCQKSKNGPEIEKTHQKLPTWHDLAQNRQFLSKCAYHPRVDPFGIDSADSNGFNHKWSYHADAPSVSDACSKKCRYVITSCNFHAFPSEISESGMTCCCCTGHYCSQTLGSRNGHTPMTISEIGETGAEFCGSAMSTKHPRQLPWGSWEPRNCLRGPTALRYLGSGAGLASVLVGVLDLSSYNDRRGYP